MNWIFYRIDNSINGKYYLGIHGTENINDSYMGSGVLLREAFKKYGKENFTKTILKVFNSEQEARKYEAENITAEILQDKNNYNIASGGGGGSKNSKHFFIKEGKHYIVHENATFKFLESHPDAIQGKPKECLQNYIKGRKTIHKENITKRIKPEELEKYLSEGWEEGASELYKRNNSSSKKGFKVMSKDGKARHVRPEDEFRFLEEGYTYGPPQWMNEKQGQGHRGHVRIHLGSIEKNVPESSLEKWLDKGYTLGNSDRRKYA